MEASRNSFIPNLAVVQIVQVYTVGIRRKCAFFRSFCILKDAAKIHTFSESAKKNCHRKGNTQSMARFMCRASAQNNVFVFLPAT